MLERADTIRVADADGQLQPAPLLDFTVAVSSSGNEHGLLALTFDTDLVHRGHLIRQLSARDRSMQHTSFVTPTRVPLPIRSIHLGG